MSLTSPSCSRSAPRDCEGTIRWAPARLRRHVGATLEAAIVGDKGLLVYTVRVAKRGGALHMQQVQVFDQSGVNVALASAGGVAPQSSVRNVKEMATLPAIDNWGAWRTIDGNVDDNARWPNSRAAL